MHLRAERERQIIFKVGEELPPVDATEFHVQARIGKMSWVSVAGVSELNYAMLANGVFPKSETRKIRDGSP
jgi:hypothetical protein